MRKPLSAALVWLLPVILVIVEMLVFLPKNLRNTSFIPYFITFWGVRAALSPLIILYTLKCWVEYNRPWRLAMVHLVGFLLFSVLFWFTSILFLHDTLYQNGLFGLNRESTTVSMFGMIVDNSLSTNIIVYVSTVAFCYAWEFFRRTTEANRKAAELERSLLQSRLEILKGQLNTHFLFNTLHTISSLVMRNKGEEANLILVKLSELLRFALKDSKEQLIPLHKELEVLQLYLDIQKTRFSDRLAIKIEHAPDLNGVLVPVFLLQPLVENAIKYAVEPFKGAGTITIDIRKRNDKVAVSIGDNGQTVFESINFDSGIGLQNTKERLSQLFGKDQSFSILPNLPIGTRVNFEFPLQYNNHE